MVCQFLLYKKVNQLYTYIYPHSSSLLHLPPSHPSRWELISLCYVPASHQLYILHLVVYICPCHSLTCPNLSIPLPVSSTPFSNRSASLFLSCPQVIHLCHILDSTYKCYHMVFFFLTYFTQYDNLQVRPCGCKWHYFILFYG